MEPNMRREYKGFTLIEILVVIGIIAILTSAIIAGTMWVRKSAYRAKAQETVENVAVAMTALFQDDGIWLKVLRNNNPGQLNYDAARALASRNYLALNLTGIDRFGVLDPWGVQHMKRHANAALKDRVVTGGTLQDHLLWYALDLDGDGVIENVDIGGEVLFIRANVAVWGAGMDGKLEPYSRGLKKDDVYSWTAGQLVEVK